MKKEIITQIVLTPDEGMRLTDGKTFAEQNVILPKSADDSVWHEITEAEYEKLLKKEESEAKLNV